MTRAQIFTEEYGNSVETQCMACKRRGRRTIYWSHEGCHECEGRKVDAAIIRKQRRVQRHPFYQIFKTALAVRV